MGDLVDYRKLVYSAMCGVVREAMSFFSKLSPTRDVHVAVSFVTNCSGVVLPDYLRIQYPESMTIVLQYQFRDLNVSENGFSVVLSFRGKEELITVPFRAIVKYVDMISNFSLDLEQYGDIELEMEMDSDNDDDLDEDIVSSHTTQDNIIFIDKFRKN
ncbi:Stringent starvation protein B [Anaplasma phagocytophilum]|uniref:ClpXP protease specificity-enhancing factor SspB n=1 Tax=Anaplasma phagocytophilum TaxID=948 RepID=UPI0007E264B3|nr:ClpXP protease specificity-enhancing factor SspB [Anaplasma phagocytophilum]SCV63000.1 Stringent starvation protein B [Anaplasma phagocytophilum]SCV63947.1 Stringent starvation protein B [Anaplasma phagocytophilum]